jgi:2-C-methyl-D-erythritol 4-phosphate cytidylyltransferase
VTVGVVVPAAGEGVRLGPGLPKALRGLHRAQGFRRAVLEAAHAGGPGDATDDAGLVERAGGLVATVEGSEEALKVTRPLDLLLAEAILVRQGRETASGGGRT